MPLNQLLITLFIIYFIAFNLAAQSLTPNNLDVLNYQVYLEPNLNEQQIKGNVRIKFKTLPKTNKVVFDAGSLTIIQVEGDNIEKFEQKGKKVIISLIKGDTAAQEIKIFYEGKPKKGLIFPSNNQKAYTVYFTNEWMVCNFSPADKATLQIELLIPKPLTSIASGVLVDSVNKVDNKRLYCWHQTYETPAYTYGFAIGTFNELHKDYKNIRLNYYAPNHTSEELETIFQYTSDMLSFFEQKAGIPFPQNTYSQILMGNHYQEMSGFAILKNTYGELVLKDSTETNLISHELAHQWWGNRITCKSWNHFWLNEGLATYLSAAYNKHRFGAEKYQQNIDAYYNVYEKIKAKGKDKPLVFKDWSNPSSADRNLVYFKGAYVFHLLRQELGDELFWKGIQFYTQKYDGQSVTTKDFQLAMETATNRQLSNFFNTWVY